VLLGVLLVGRSVLVVQPLSCSLGGQGLLGRGHRRVILRA